MFQPFFDASRKMIYRLWLVPLWGERRDESEFVHFYILLDKSGIETEFFSPEQERAKGGY